MPSQEREFVRRVLIANVVTLIIAVLFVMSWYAVQILLLLFGAVLFAIFVRAISDMLAGRGILGPRAAVATVLLAIGAALAFSAWMLAPAALDQLQRLSDRLPEIKQRLDQAGFGFFLSFGGAETLLSGSGTLTSRMVSLLSQGVVSPLYAGMAAIVGVFLSVQPSLYKRGIVRLTPLPKRERASVILNELSSNLRWWILGKGIGMAFVGVFVGIGLWIISIPMPFTLGVVAGLLDFIPNIGGILSAVPAALLAILQEPSKVLWVLLIYVASHSIDNYVVLPLLQLRLVRLPPAVSLSSQLLLGYLVGPLGLIFAVPIALLAMVLVKMLYLHATLGDPDEH